MLPTGLRIEGHRQPLVVPIEYFDMDLECHRSCSVRSLKNRPVVVSRAAKIHHQ